MHNFTSNYEKILEVLKELEFESENFLSQIREPKLTDLKVIVINLTSEYMSIDSARSKICKEADYALPNRGYCASQKMHYYGYKLHASARLKVFSRV